MQYPVQVPACPLSPPPPVGGQQRNSWCECYVGDSEAVQGQHMPLCGQPLAHYLRVDAVRLDMFCYLLLCADAQLHSILQRWQICSVEMKEMLWFLRMLLTCVLPECCMYTSLCAPLAGEFVLSALLITVNSQTLNIQQCLFELSSNLTS